MKKDNIIILALIGVILLLAFSGILFHKQASGASDTSLQNVKDSCQILINNGRTTYCNLWQQAGYNRYCLTYPLNTSSDCGGGAYNYLGQYPTSSINTGCSSPSGTDSQYYCTSGNLKQCNGGTWNTKDTCGTGYTCVDNSAHTISTYSTPFATLCQKTVTQCTDSDHGLYPDMYGSVTDYSGNHPDTCLNTSFVNEHYCANNADKVIVDNCPGGCENGACQALSSCSGSNTAGCLVLGPKCIDSAHYCAKAYSTGSGWFCTPADTSACTCQTVQGTDQCVIIGGSSSSSSGGSSSSSSGSGASCSDSDGGLYPDILGSVTDANGNHADTCLNTSFVNEHYCVNNADNVINDYCPGGCLNGACQPSPSCSQTNLTGCSIIGPKCINASFYCSMAYEVGTTFVCKSTDSMVCSCDNIEGTDQCTSGTGGVGLGGTPGPTCSQWYQSPDAKGTCGTNWIIVGAILFFVAIIALKVLNKESK